MSSKKGVYVTTSMTEKQIKEATKEQINIEDSYTISKYKKKGYNVDDRNKLFNKYIQNEKRQFVSTPGRKKINEKNTFKMELPRVELEKIINNINGGCTRIDYY